MSVECIVWALTEAPIPRDRRDAPSLAITLVGLANHAYPDGSSAFPAVSTLMAYTRLSESTVRRALDALESLGLISPADPVIVAAHIKRADRRPQGWNLAIHKRYPQDADGVSPRQAADLDGVSTHPERGVNSGRTGCHGDTRNVLNPSRNLPARERAPEARSLPPVCGACDARESDPVSARVVWLDSERSRSERCPRCHPTEATR